MMLTERDSKFECLALVSCLRFDVRKFEHFSDQIVSLFSRANDELKPRVQKKMGVCNGK